MTVWQSLSIHIVQGGRLFHPSHVLRCDREQAARATVEDMAQGTKRETGQQLRELQVEHGAALRQLASVQEAATRVQQNLKARFIGAPQHMIAVLYFSIFSICLNCIVFDYLVSLARQSS